MIVLTLLRVNKQNDPNEDDDESLDFDGILPQKKQVDVASINGYFVLEKKIETQLSYYYSAMVKYISIVF
jgi:hypothetical protein